MYGVLEFIGMPWWSTLTWHDHTSLHPRVNSSGSRRLTNRRLRNRSFDIVRFFVVFRRSHGNIEQSEILGFRDSSNMLRKRKHKACGCLSSFRARASTSRRTSFSRPSPFRLNLFWARETERGSFVASGPCIQEHRSSCCLEYRPPWLAPVVFSV